MGIERAKISQSVTEGLRRVLSIQKTTNTFLCLLTLSATYPTTALAAWLQTCSRDWQISLNCKRHINWFNGNIWLPALWGSYRVNLLISNLCTARNLSGNIISTMDPGVFQELPSLKLVWVLDTVGALTPTNSLSQHTIPFLSRTINILDKDNMYFAESLLTVFCNDFKSVEKLR